MRRWIWASMHNLTIFIETVNLSITGRCYDVEQVLGTMIVEGFVLRAQKSHSVPQKVITRQIFKTGGREAPQNRVSLAFHCTFFDGKITHT